MNPLLTLVTWMAIVTWLLILLYYAGIPYLRTASWATSIAGLATML